MTAELSGNRSPMVFPRGVIAPMFTPFTAGGELDFRGAGNLVRYLAGTGYVDGIFVRSGLGQMYTFTVAETLALARTAIDAAEGSVPILVGCAGEWDKDPLHRPDPQKYIDESVHLVREAFRMGAAAAVLVIPVALSSSGSDASETVVEYYRRVAVEAGGPIVIYQPPGVPAEYRVTPAVMRELLKLPAVRGMKLSVSTHEEFAPIAEAVRGRGFALIAGAEGFFLEALKLGAVGVIGQGCNTYPEILRAVQRYYEAGDLDAAEKAQEAVNSALMVTDGYDTGVMCKQILILRGVQMQAYGRNRPELYPAEAVSRAKAEIDRLAEPYRRK
ncbi:MAG: dihydrodipicolinate synthase family protein [Armatimonadota bacterium]